MGFDQDQIDFLTGQFGEVHEKIDENRKEIETKLEAHKNATTDAVGKINNDLVGIQREMLQKERECEHLMDEKLRHHAEGELNYFAAIAKEEASKATAAHENVKHNVSKTVNTIGGILGIIATGVVILWWILSGYNGGV